MNRIVLYWGLGKNATSMGRQRNKPVISHLTENRIHLNWDANMPPKYLSVFHMTVVSGAGVSHIITYHLPSVHPVKVRKHKNEPILLLLLLSNSKWKYKYDKTGPEWQFRLAYHSTHTHRLSFYSFSAYHAITILIALIPSCCSCGENSPSNIHIPQQPNWSIQSCTDMTYTSSYPTWEKIALSLCPYYIIMHKANIKWT